MAYEIPGFSFTLPAGVDFSSDKQFRFVSANSSGQVIAPAAAGNAVVGVRQTRPKEYDATTIVASGVSFVEAGAAVTAGQEVTCDTSGRAIHAATAGNLVHGVALETAGASGVQIAVLLYINGHAVSS